MYSLKKSKRPFGTIGMYKDDLTPILCILLNSKEIKAHDLMLNAILVFAGTIIY